MKAILCPIHKNKLDRLYTVDKLTDAEIASRLGNGATDKRVRTWRKKAGIKTIPRWSRNEVPPIEGKLRSLLVGSMLGDGGLVRRVHATHYQEAHMALQRPYLEWKAKMWGSWAKADLMPVEWVKEAKTYHGFRFHTCAHESLNAWRDLFYDNREKGSKRLVPEVVDLVDPFALAVWYLDDGGAAWWPDITTATVNRPVAEQIFAKFGLKPRWQQVKPSTGVFHMERDDTANEFLALIRPHVPKCMAYKVKGFGYNTGRNNAIKAALDVDTLQGLVDQGMPIRQIAATMGVGGATIDRHLRKHDIEHPRLKGNPNHRTGTP